MSPRERTNAGRLLEEYTSQRMYDSTKLVCCRKPATKYQRISSKYRHIGCRKHQGHSNPKRKWRKKQQMKTLNQTLMRLRLLNGMDRNWSTLHKRKWSINQKTRRLTLRRRRSNLSLWRKNQFYGDHYGHSAELPCQNGGSKTCRTRRW